MTDQNRADIRGEAEAYVRQGIAKVEQRDYTGAIADCDRAIDLDPGCAEAYRERGLAKSLLGADDSAII